MWSDEGSPLAAITRRQAQALARRNIDQFPPAEFEAAGMKKFGKPELMPNLRALAARLAAVEPFAHAGMEEAARALAAEAGVGLGALAQPARLALTGSLASPPLFEVIELLGKETALRRMAAFAARVEGLAGAS